MKESLEQIKSLDDEYLIENIQVGVRKSECLNEIINRHSGIYLDVIHKYYKDNDNQLKKDLLSDKEYNIYQAAIKYSSNKNTKFSTYLGNQTKWICLNTYNKNRKNKSEELDDVVVCKKSESIDIAKKLLDDQQVDEVFSLIKNRFSKNVIRIFKMRYLIGKKNKTMPWKNVSEKIGYSIQGCINIHNSALAEIKNLMQNDIHE